MDEYAREYGIDHPEGWYSVTLKDIQQKQGGTGLVKNYYGNSLYRALCTIYPEVEWDPTKFSKAPHRFWTNVEYQRAALEAVGKELGVKDLDDWYSVKVTDLYAVGNGVAKGIMRQYSNSLARTLQALYSDHQWDPARFTKVTTGYWDNIDNQRKLLDRIGSELGVKVLPDDWYNITLEQVRAMKGAKTMLNRHYGGSLKRALRAIYPEHSWTTASFKKVPNAHWKNISNQREFFDRAGEQLGVKRPEDWYGITAEQVIAKGGRGPLLEYYGGSLVRALKAVYPEYPWRDDEFKKAPKNYWDDLNNQRCFFEALARKLNVESLDDWHGVSLDKVRSMGGNRFLAKYYSNSLFRALKTLYPQHPWESWRFARTRTSTEEDTRGGLATLRSYIEALAKHFGIQHLDDWYRVSQDRIVESFGGIRLIKRGGGLALVLRRLYPHHAWDESKFVAAKLSKKTQRWLLLAAHRLFPNEELIEDYLHPELAFATSSLPMELDIFIPSLSLAFEYNGVHHYTDVFLFGSRNSYSTLDSEKQAACQKAGITLVSVPYWWDRRVESLAATVLLLRPDLSIDDSSIDVAAAEPIPTSPPSPPPAPARSASSSSS